MTEWHASHDPRPLDPSEDPHMMCEKCYGCDCTDTAEAAAPCAEEPQGTA